MSDRTHPGRRRFYLVLGMAALALGFWFVSDCGFAGGGRGTLDADITSTYSHMRITTANNVRTLWFVRDPIRAGQPGEEVIESQIKLDMPHDLLIDYTKYMFLSYLFKPKQDKVLIVGLGGGAMIHFLKKYDPNLKVDVVEIDPKIVEVADKYFGVRAGGNVNIVTQDAFVYLKDTKEKYDVIYMDAFLKPSRETDETGSLLKLKTLQFYRSLHQKLNPNGMVVYNINPHPRINNDVANIRESFPQSYVYELPYGGGLVVVGSLSKERLSRDTLREDADKLDARFKTSFRFRDMARSQIK
jgi:spermidine synthase